MTDILKIERKYFEAIKKYFLDNYNGKYIALKDKNVIDQDIDFSILAKRVYEKFGYEPIFMTMVTEKEIYKIPSVRIHRK